MTDLSPDRQPDPAAADPALVDPATGEALLPVPVAVAPRQDGWTAERQRVFLQTLAETGCVAESAEAAGMTARSAYRLRARADADAFDTGWTEALRLATHRLTAIAWDRAVNGTERTIWHKGEVVGVERVPSDRLLMFLLRAFDPYAHREKILWNGNPRQHARQHIAESMAGLADRDEHPAGDPEAAKRRRRR